MTPSWRSLALLALGAVLAVALSAMVNLTVSAHGGDTTLIHGCVQKNQQKQGGGANYG